MEWPIQILHVDDQPEFAEMTATFLKQEDERFEVESATDPQRGLELLRNREFDCVVSDYEMPTLDGIELLGEVREMYPELPFILFTGKGSEEIASEAISAGVTDYLQKGPSRDQYTVLANRIVNAVERSRAQQAVEQSERQLRKAYERITDGVFAVDVDWEYTYVNDEGAGIVGQRKDDLIGTSVWEAFPELVGTPFEERLRTAMETRETMTIEEYYPPHDTWYDVTVYPDAEGISIFFQDVTEDKERESELEETNAVLSTLFETLPYGVIAEDNERNVLAVNERMFELFELPGSPEESVGKDCEQLARSVSDMFVEPDTFVEQINQLLDVREPTHGEELELKDGRTFERSYRPIELLDGRGHLWVYRDITEHKERERTVTALHGAAHAIGRADDSQMVYETLIETAEEILDFDLVAVDVERDGYLIQEAWSLGDGESEYWERTSLDEDTFAVRAFKRQETILVDDLRESEIVPADPEYRSALTVPIGEFGTFQTVFSEPDAFDERDVEFAELLVDHARVKLSQLQDKRQLRARTTELERQNERLDNFASFVSHDLRNPLNVANLRLDLVADECESEHVTDVQHALDRMEDLIDDLLTLARRGETVGSTKKVSLPDVVSRCWENVDTGNAQIECESGLRIRADERRLRGMFENLFRNAVEHGGESVTIRVGSLTGNEGFFVEDDGDGLPTETGKDLFDSGFTTRDEGTGFGLTIVKDVVDAHDWEIHATEGSDGGARFEISSVELLD